MRNHQLEEMHIPGIRSGGILIIVPRLEKSLGGRKVRRDRLERIPVQPRQ